jgi:putative MATE family efflux protein
MITFSIPFVLANTLQILYNMVDMVIVGRFVGSTGLSAVSVGSDMIHLELLLCVGFTAAGQIVISQCVGADDQEGIRHCIGALFTIMAAAAVIVTGLGMIFMDPILNILNVPQESFAQAKAYCMVCFGGTIFSYGYNLVSSVLRGMGDSKRPLYFVAIASGINVVLDLVFVALLRMDTFGAALATVIGQAFSLVVSLVYLYRRREELGFDFKPRSFIPEKSTCVILFRLGIPLALQHSAVALSQLFIASNINSYGLVVSAVNGVGTKIGQVSMIVTNALSTAASTMIGQNFAAGKKDRVSKVVWNCWGINVGFCSVLAILVLLFPEQIFGIFNKEAAILAMSHTYSIVAALNFIGAALRSPMMALINGLGCARFAIVVGVLDGIVARILLAILLGEVCGMGIMGYWLGGVFAGFVPFFVGGVFFWSGLWKKVKPVTEKK